MVHFEDSRLKPIRERSVEAGERLSFDDGIALNRTSGSYWGSAISRTSCGSACTATAPTSM
jgi:hypothetical protein